MDDRLERDIPKILTMLRTQLARREDMPPLRSVASLRATARALEEDRVELAGADEPGTKDPARRLH